MSLFADLFAIRHAGFIAAAFGIAFVLIGAELLVLGRRVRRTPGSSA